MPPGRREVAFSPGLNRPPGTLLHPLHPVDPISWHERVDAAVRLAQVSIRRGDPERALYRLEPLHRELMADACPAVAANLLFTLAVAYAASGAAHSLRRAAALLAGAMALLGALDPRRIACRYNRGVVLVRLRRFAEASVELRRAAEASAELLGINRLSLLRSRILGALAVAHAGAGNHVAAQAARSDSLAAAEDDQLGQALRADRSREREERASGARVAGGVPVRRAT